MKIATRFMLSSAVIGTFLGALVGLTNSASASKLKSYQVSGPVVELSDSTITVEKAKGERWTIARDAITKTIGGNLKIGDRVTISYTMEADNIEVKPAKAPAKTDSSTIKQ